MEYNKKFRIVDIPLRRYNTIITNNDFTECVTYSDRIFKFIIKCNNFLILIYNTINIYNK